MSTSEGNDAAPPASKDIVVGVLSAKASKREPIAQQTSRNRVLFDLTEDTSNSNQDENPTEVSSRMHMWDPDVRHNGEKFSVASTAKAGPDQQSIPNYWRNSIMTVHLGSGGLGNFSLTCVVVNLISAGYILLPQAFAKAGTLLSCLVLGAVSMQTYISGNFVLVAGAYAEAQENRNFRGELPRQYSMALRDRKYEVSNLYRRFLSYPEATFFTLTTMGDLYGITWALCAIFASTMAEQIPFGFDPYKIYVLIFIGVGVPLSCTTVIDQVGVQLLFLCLRMLMVVAMLITIFVAWGKNHFGDFAGPANDVPLADFSQLIQIIMTSIFSTAYQFSVPCMVASSKDNKGAGWIFGKATIFVYLSNLIVSLFVSIYFGHDGTLGASTLHWANYNAGVQGEDLPWWVTALSGYISMFAAIDGVAVFPLIAIALGDILMSVVYGDKVHIAEENWKIRLVFRLLASVPQAIGAMFVSDLSVIAVYAGVCTLLSYTTAPAYLYLRSRRQAVTDNIPLETHYTSSLSSPTAAFGLIGVSLAIVVAVVVDFVQDS